MTKLIPCPKCNGLGFETIFTECSVTSRTCDKCSAMGFVEVPMTNADYIRSMTDEQLARMLTYGDWNFDCSECKDGKKRPECDCDCQAHCLEWLQQDVRR